MGSRRMIIWRIHVYANNLHSLPLASASSYREWDPFVYSRNPDEVHRIMNWVNRDVSVLVRSSKAELLQVYDLVLSLLPRVSLRSSEFKDALTGFLGAKTPHFVHELINFARSPYDEIIAYECNVQYRALAEEKEQQRCLDGLLLNFVEFSRRLNDDDCSGLTMELELEDEDPDELDELAIFEEHNRTVQLETRRFFQERRGQLAGQLQRQQFSGFEINDVELEMAIERSMLQGGGSAAEHLMAATYGSMVRTLPANLSRPQAATAASAAASTASALPSAAPTAGGIIYSSAAGAAAAVALATATVTRGAARRNFGLRLKQRQQQ